MKIIQIYSKVQLIKMQFATRQQNATIYMQIEYIFRFDFEWKNWLCEKFQWKTNFSTKQNEILSSFHINRKSSLEQKYSSRNWIRWSNEQWGRNVMATLSAWKFSTNPSNGRRFDVENFLDFLYRNFRVFSLVYSC